MDRTLITELRNLTGAGIGDCQKALEQAGGNIEKALDILRQTGAIKAAKKSHRHASEGRVVSYIHPNHKVGVLLALSCETDFAAKSEVFGNLAHDLALQVAASQPLYVSPALVPPAIIDREKNIYFEQLSREGKPASMVDKIVAGKIEKFLQNVCLLKQAFIKDETITIQELIEQKIAVLGEKIEVKNFIRFSI